MSDEPRIADTKPQVLDLKAGNHFYCACGRTGNQVFCDGSHAGTGITPKKFTVEEDGRAALCMCRRSKNLPYCDGTHATLSEEDLAE